MENFTERLFSHYKSHPERVIIHFQKTGETDRHITYQELVVRSMQYAHALQAEDIQPGEVVIIILEHSLNLIFSYFGCVLAGTIPSIMPFLTEKLRPEKYRDDLKTLIEITEPSAIITYADFYKEIAYLDYPDSSVQSVLLSETVGAAGVSDCQFESIAGLNRKPADVVLLQHSSGTTGLQKGVALSHQAVFNQIASYSKAIHLSETDVVVSWLPLYHDMGLIASFLMPILYGTQLVLMSPFDWVRAPQKLLQSVDEYRGTLTWLPNFAYNFCAQKIRTNDLVGIDLSSLRAVVNCSEPMRYESHMMFYDRFKHYGFRKSALATSYAMAENVFAVTQGGIDEALRYDDIDLETLQKESRAVPSRTGALSIKMVSAGKPIDGTQVKIIQDGNNLKEREVGEILIRGDCMLTGYYNREDATERSITNGWFATGDLGYLAGGELYITGRKKDLIIVGGKNIYPQDLEEITMEVNGVHPGRAVAFGLFNEQKGTEDVVVIAEFEPDYAEKKQEMANQIRQRVSQNTAVALRTVYLVPERWLIKTSSGKIARTANKEKYLTEILKKQ